MVVCSVRECKSTFKKNSNLKFYKFPKNEKLRESWANFCDSRKPINFKTAHVCSNHFTREDFTKTLINKILNKSPKRFRNLLPNAVPSLFGPELLSESQRNRLRNEIASCSKQTENLRCSMEEIDQSNPDDYDPTTTNSKKLWEERINKLIEDNEIIIKSSSIQKVQHSPVIGDSTTFDDPPKSNDLTMTVHDTCTVNKIAETKISKNLDMKEEEERLNKIIAEHEDILKSNFIQKVDYQPIIGNSRAIEDASIISDSEMIDDPPIIEDLTVIDDSPNAENDMEVEDTFNKPVATKTTAIPEITLEERFNAIISKHEEILKSNYGLPDQALTIPEQRLKAAQTQIKHLVAQVGHENMQKNQIGIVNQENAILNSYIVVKESINDADFKKLHEKITFLEEQNKLLQKQNDKLSAENLDLLERNKKHDKILNLYFTSGQIKRMFSENCKSRLNWSNEDISSAISLRCASIKGYRYLKFVKKVPLPDASTLRRWALKVSVEEGILWTVLSLMEQKGKEMSMQDRLTVINFDEMSLSSFYCFDKASETIYGETEKVQVVMIRGLIGGWRQPIAYYFDTDMTPTIINEIIMKLYEIDFIVVALVSDLGGSNRSFLRQMSVSVAFHTFPHPSENDLKIFCFADAPHLLKLLRNHLLDQGYIYQQTEITKSVFEKILKISTTELKISFKLNRARHLDVTGPQRQRVAPAAELISESTANLIEYCTKNKLISCRNYETVCHFFRTMNSWFDLFNSTNKCEKLSDAQAYGTNLIQQNKKLEQIIEVVGGMRIIKKLKNGANSKSMLPFQQGIIMSVKSLQDMYSYLKDKYNVQYILTRRINQDALENFFAYIRGMGGTNDHPLPTEFKQRIKLYILGRNSSSVFTLNKNTEEIGDESCLITPSKTFKPMNKKIIMTPEEEDNIQIEELIDEVLEGESDVLLTTNLKKIIEEKDDELTPAVRDGEISEEDLNNIYKFTSQSSITAQDVVESEGFKYVVGYIAHKYRAKYPHLGKVTGELTEQDNSWISFVSKGNLMVPAPQFLQALKHVEKCFLDFHGVDGMKRGKGSITEISQTAMETLKKELPRKTLQQIPRAVIRYFIQVRSNIRMRECNLKIKANNLKKFNAKKFNNKLNKF